MKPKNELGEAIKRARVRAGMSQQALATKIKKSRAVVGVWERGVSTPLMENLEALAFVLKVKPGDLLPNSSASQVRELEELRESLAGLEGFIKALDGLPKDRRQIFISGLEAQIAVLKDGF